MTLDDIRTKHFVVGLKETERSLSNGTAAFVFIASDCDDRILKPLLDLCRKEDVPFDQSHTKKELGHACGIKVRAATCAVLKSR